MEHFIFGRSRGKVSTPLTPGECVHTYVYMIIFMSYTYVTGVDGRVTHTDVQVSLEGYLCN